MWYDTVYDALFFIWTNCIQRASSVKLSLATAFTFWAIKNFVNIRSFTATFELIHTRCAAKTPASFDSGWFWVVPTITHFCNWVKFLTPIAPDQIEVWPDLPVNFFPADSVCFSNKSYEFLEIPISVNHMFCSHLSVCVNTLKAITAGQNFSLLFSEKLGTVSALMKLIFIFFEKQF